MEVTEEMPCVTLQTPPNFALDEREDHTPTPQSPGPIMDIEENPFLFHESSLFVEAYSAKHSSDSRTNSTDWIMDSGCTEHMFHDRNEFTIWASQRSAVTIADGNVIYTLE